MTTKPRKPEQEQPDDESRLSWSDESYEGENDEHIARFEQQEKVGAADLLSKEIDSTDLREWHSEEELARLEELRPGIVGLFETSRNRILAGESHLGDYDKGTWLNRKAILHLTTSFGQTWYIEATTPTWKERSYDGDQELALRIWTSDETQDANITQISYDFQSSSEVSKTINYKDNMSGRRSSVGGGSYEYDAVSLEELQELQKSLEEASTD